MRDADDFLVFGSPLIGEDEIDEVVRTLRSGWLGTGPKVARFEQIFREAVGTKHALALSSCTAALHLSYLVAGIGPGDEVITSPMTFCATANAVIHSGARPVFVDIDPATFNIDPDRIEEAITERTRAITPVHMCGRPCDMDRITRIARRRGLLIIEDAAHSIEGVYRGRRIGSIGDAGCFSFYVTKNVVTGEGGMFCTDNDDWADKVKMYALHGMSADAWKRYSDQGYKHYRVVFPGFKYNMTDIQASLGIHQMPRIEKYLARRGEIWAAYDEAFADLPCETPAPPEPETVHARHLYTILIDPDRAGKTRDQVQRELHERNIGTGIHFVSLHLHPYYRDAFDLKPEDFPHARTVSERTLSLPLSAKLTDRDVGDVIEAVRDVLG